MKFNTEKYFIFKKALSKDLTDFIYNYFILKRKVAVTLFNSNWISPFSQEWGVWNDPQIPNTYSHYADVVMETLLSKVKPILEKKLAFKLSPNYSYARIYKKGDILKRHKDRFSCEISTTLNLGGDLWPIYLEPSGKEGAKGIKVNLNPGDMLIYSGCELEHWREPFEGENCAQVFLHYNKIGSEEAKLNKFDRRPHLGLPAYFKGKK
jgi:hypothetical protein